MLKVIDNNELSAFRIPVGWICGLFAIIYNHIAILFAQRIASEFITWSKFLSKQFFVKTENSLTLKVGEVNAQNKKEGYKWLMAKFDLVVSVAT